MATTNLNPSGTPAPKVTVICVTYNASAVLQQLFDSIALYKTPDTEFIIVDGQSTDATLDVIKTNQHLVDFWLSEPDKGIYDAMNKAVTYANGRWIMFVGADDTLESGFAAMVDELQAANTIYYGNVIFYGTEKAEVFDDYTLTKHNICHQSIFYPKAVFNKYKYDTQYKVLADYHLNLRCWADKAFPFEYRNHLVASYAKGGFSSHVTDEQFEADRNKLYKQFINRYTYYRYINRTTGWKNTLKSIILNR